MVMYNDKPLKNKPEVLYNSPGKDPRMINNANIYAFISTNTSFEDFLTIIRMVRLTEEEKNVYELLLRNSDQKKISEELEISLASVKPLLQSVKNKLKLNIDV